MYNIVCFSFAGGNSYSYNLYKKYISDDINLITFDYPGRGKRFSEDLITDINMLVSDMYQHVKSALHEPYTLYGHSMGGLMAYCMARHLLLNNEQLPDGVFITGCWAPSFSHNQKLLQNLPINELIEELKIMQGIPKEILDDKDFMKFYAPILRADFTAVSSYKHLDAEPIDIPFKVITGSSENISIAEALQWQQVTSFKLDYKQMTGGHFFILDNAQNIAQELMLCKHQWARKR